MARKARLFPIRVALGGTADFDLAYFLLATECLIDLGFTSPQPILNIDLYCELLADAELPGEAGQAVMLDDIDGIASEPSPSLDVFMGVLWDFSIREGEWLPTQAS